MRYSEMIEQPVTTKKYSIYDVKDLPKVFLGIRIKNRYDEDRMQIKEKYKPKYISHFRLLNELEPFYMYGIEITPTKQYKKLLKELNNNINFLPNMSFNKFVSRYESILTDHGLSCNTCYRYLSDGLYPIDVNHVTSISKKNLCDEFNSGFKSMITESDEPWYLNTNNFNLYILGFSTGYNLDFQLNTSHR